MTFRIEYFLDGENIDFGFTGDFDTLVQAEYNVREFILSYAHRSGNILTATIVEIK